MPKLDLLLLPLLGGYWFLNLFYFTKFYHQRIEKQRLIFNSSIVAIFISFLGGGVDNLLLNFFPNFREFLGKMIWVDYEGLKLSFLIFGISPLLAVILNFIPKRLLMYLIIKWRGDQFEKLLWNSLREKDDKDKLIMITLSTRKVYVGIVNKIQKPIGDSYVSMLPYFSGFRDNDTLDFIITTNYFKVIEELVNNNQEELIDSKMGVILHKKDIHQITRFDKTVFDKFN